MCPLRSQLCPPHRGAQAKSGGALFIKFSGASRRKRCAPSLLKPFRRLCLDRRHTCNFLARFCRATLSRNFLAVAQLLFRMEERSILCNFVAKMRVNAVGQFLFMRQSCSVRHGVSHMQFCRSIKLRDKIAR